VFPRKWSSRTAIRSGSILPQNTVTAAFACRDGKHDFYACVDQKNHRIFRCQRNYPLKIQIILLSAGELVLHRSEKSYKLLWKHRLTRAHREKQLKMSCQALHNAPPNRT